MCGERLWKLCDSKAVSLSRLNRGAEGRRILGSQESTFAIDQLGTRELWIILHVFFIKQRNITLDRYVFRTRKQLPQLRPR